MPDTPPGSAHAWARALLCMPADDDACAAVHAAVERSGMVVVGEVARGLDALAATVEHRADVAILHLSLVGTLGLRLIGLIKTVAPNVAVVALSPFDALVAPALDAGAAVALTTAELHHLTDVLGGLGSSAGERQPQHEPAILVHEVPAMGSGDGARDRQAES